MKKLLIVMCLVILIGGAYFFPLKAPTVNGSTIVPVTQGGIGTTSVPRFYLLMGSTTGQLTAMSTSSLGIQASPGGANTQVQFNNSGSFAGSWGLAYNNVVNEPTLYLGDPATTSITFSVARTPVHLNSSVDIFGENFDGSAYFDLFAATSSGSSLTLKDDKANTTYYSNFVDLYTGGIDYFMYYPHAAGNFVISSTTSLFAGQMLSTTTSIMSGGLTLGTCDTVTSTIPGASMSSTTVVESTPQTWPGLSTFWYSYVTNATTIVTKECGLGIVTPTATAYNLDVFQ